VLAVLGCQLLKVVDIGDCSGEEVDEWAIFGFGALTDGEVAALLVGWEGVIADMEFGCEVQSVGFEGCEGLVSVGDGEDGLGRHGRTIYLPGDGRFAVDGVVMDLRKRMVL
jgi:hypothetical protein